jgi:hypothetical protein
MAEGKSAVYAYCLVRGPAPDQAALPSGLPSTSPPRPVRVDDELWLVVSDAPLRHYGAEAIASQLDDLEWVSQRAMAHEAVVEHFLPADAVLPMKLFTLFESEASALEHLRRTRARTRRLLERLGGRVEWGVRLRFAAPKTPRKTRTGAPTASGRAFLEARREERQAAGRALEAARALAEDCYRELGAASQASWRAELPAGPAAGGLLLDAAFLLARGRSPSAPAFEKDLRRWAQRLRTASVETVLTGPWPPYHFMEST